MMSKRFSGLLAKDSVVSRMTVSRAVCNDLCMKSFVRTLIVQEQFGPIDTLFSIILNNRGGHARNFVDDNKFIVNEVIKHQII